MKARKIQRKDATASARPVASLIHPDRRMLAQNVVSLFREERPAVKQLPGFRRWRRGRSVYLENFSWKNRISIGSFVEFTQPKCAHNIGKIGIVTESESPNEKNGWKWTYQLRAVEGKFAYIQDGENEVKYERELWAAADRLRRVWTGGGRYNARLWEGRA